MKNHNKYYCDDDKFGGIDDGDGFCADNRGNHFNNPSCLKQLPSVINLPGSQFVSNG